MTAAAIIPARWASTRFPGKPLFPILGKPLIQHVWEHCLKAKRLSQIIIATDDMRIAEAAFDFGAEVSLTSPKHPSGTDRIAEVAARLRGFGHIINVQGDEPALDPRLIDQLVQALQLDPKLKMVTAASPFETESDALNPNNVKVVTALDGKALYFSRSLIPFDRDKLNPPHTTLNPQLSTLNLSGTSASTATGAISSCSSSVGDPPPSNEPKSSNNFAPSSTVPQFTSSGLAIARSA